MRRIAFHEYPNYATRSLLVWVCLLSGMMFITSCDLKRDNPLDPDGNASIHLPPQVIGLTAIASSANAANKFVQLTWNRNDIYTAGYYVYMSLAYNSAYVKEAYTLNPDGQSITHTYSGLAPGYYYFKVSAFNYRGDDTMPPNFPDPLAVNSVYLEGHLSDYIIINVP